jgi:hypothetical protein
MVVFIAIRKKFFLNVFKLVFIFFFRPYFLLAQDAESNIPSARSGQQPGWKDTDVPVSLFIDEMLA